MADDNRRFSRIPFKVQVELRVDESRYTSVEISNLSVGGCLLPIMEEFQPGSPCRVKIMLEGTSEDMWVIIEGEIVRCVPEGVAIKFTRIEPESLFHLQNIIRYNSPDADTIENEINRHPGIK